jgi:hypothetical protein
MDPQILQTIMPAVEWPRPDGTGFAPPRKTHMGTCTTTTPVAPRLRPRASAPRCRAPTRWSSWRRRRSRRERPSAPRPTATRWWCTSIPTASPATTTEPAGSKPATRCTPRPPAGSGATRAWCASSSATAGRCRSDRTRHAGRASLQAPSRANRCRRRHHASPANPVSFNAETETAGSTSPNKPACRASTPTSSTYTGSSLGSPTPTAVSPEHCRCAKR